MGNVLIMCALFHRYFEEHRLRAGFVNDGDDCVVIVEREDLPVFSDVVGWFKRYGFTMKRDEDVDIFEKISFCQSNPVWVKNRWVMVRDPRITTTRDAAWLRPLPNAKQWRRQCGAVAICGKKLTDGVPVSYAWYSALGGDKPRNDTIDYTRSGMEYLADGMTDTESDITPATRASFYKAFDIIPDRQEAIEAALVAAALAWTKPAETRVAPRVPWLQF
jgi:hypothetical protein